MLIYIIFTILQAICLTIGQVRLEKYGIYDQYDVLDDDTQTLMKIIKKNRIPDRYLNYRDKKLLLSLPGINRLKLSQFAWKTCGGLDDLIVIGNITLMPDPIKLPGTLTVSLAAKIKTDIKAPIEAQLTIKKKVGILWVTVPCVDNVGSCNYSSICSMLSNVTCPDPVIQIGQDCRCPIKQSDGFDMQPSEFDIKQGGEIPTGDYEIQAQVTQGGSVPVICIVIQFTIEH